MTLMTHSAHQPPAGLARRLTLPLIAILAFALSACSSTPANASWPGVTLGSNNTAFLADANFVSAVSVNSGALLWKYPEKAVPGETFYGEPTIDSKGRVVVGSINGTVVQLDPATGKENWATTFNTVKIVGPILENPDGNYIVPLDNGTLTVVNQASGALVSPLNLKGTSVWGTMTVQGATLYIGALEHAVIAYDTATNAVVWKKDLGDSVAGGVTLVDGKILAGTFGDKIVALDPAKGDLIWEVPTKGWVWNPPTAAAGVAYATDLSGTIQAINITDGTVVWQKGLGSPAQAAPAVTASMVIVGTKDGILRALSTTDGTQQWEQTLGGSLLGNLVVAGDLVLVTDQGGKNPLIAVRIESGAIAWSFTQPS